MVWWCGWWLSRFTNDVLIKSKKKIFWDRGVTRYGSKNQPCSPKNRYFLIFWPYHVILHTLKPRNNQPVGIQLVKKKSPAMVLFNMSRVLAFVTIFLEMSRSYLLLSDRWKSVISGPSTSKKIVHFEPFGPCTFDFWKHSRSLFRTVHLNS